MRFTCIGLVEQDVLAARVKLLLFITDIIVTIFFSLLMGGSYESN